MDRRKYLVKRITFEMNISELVEMDSVKELVNFFNKRFTPKELRIKSIERLGNGNFTLTARLIDPLQFDDILPRIQETPGFIPHSIDKKLSFE